MRYNNCLIKRFWVLLLMVFISLALAGCSSKIKGDEALMAKARRELPVSDADTIDLKKAGSCQRDKEALIWFISGNEYQAHYYLPMSFEVVGENEYTFIHTHKPAEWAMDIATLQWKGGYSFIINNPNCVALKINDNSGTKEIKINEYPFVFYNEIIPSEFVFLDKDGNEIY